MRFSFRARIGTATVAAIVLATTWLAASALSQGKLSEREIVPGKSIGYAALGMTRKQVKRALKSPLKPTASHDSHLDYLTYSYPYRPDNPGGPLIVGMKKAAPHRVVALVTGDPRLSTRPDDVGVGSEFFAMLSAFPGANCYHRNPDGTRDENIDDFDNFECELKKNDGFTYFGYPSHDSDPQEHIISVGVTARKIH